MKNIFLLPTQNNKSKLATYSYTGSKIIKVGELGLQLDNTVGWTNCWQEKEMYITSDEEIKDGEYGICLNLVKKGFKSHQAVFKMDAEQRQAMEELGGQKKAEVLKAVLTTDQDLIKDGVQGIDDEFLEWFVKNPSCEEVIVTNLYGDFNPVKYEYKIIIPKEDFKIKPKQETIEEVAERISKTNSVYESSQDDFYQGFIQGAKWQQENSNVNGLDFEINALKREIKVLRHQQEQERMYSEEDLLDLLMFIEVPKKKSHIKEIESVLKSWISRKKRN